MAACANGWPRNVRDADIRCCSNPVSRPVQSRCGPLESADRGQSNDGAEQVIDARSAARFRGEESEVRPGLRPGHIPQSLNLPFSEISNPETGEVKPVSAIRAAFTAAGLDLAKPVVATCGSGVTAGALVFGLYLLGKTDVAVYDGSWSEWGLPGDTPVETGETGTDRLA